MRLFIALQLQCCLKSPRHFLCGFEAFLWNGQTARPCSTRRELMIMQKKKSHDCKNCQLLEALTARITKFSMRTFCSGFSIDLLCSYLQFSSSFHFHLCPAVPCSFSLPATFMP